MAWPKSQDKNLNILRTKKLLRWNKKHFSSFLKAFNEENITIFWKVRAGLEDLVFVFHWKSFQGKSNNGIITQATSRDILIKTYCISEDAHLFFHI